MIIPGIMTIMVPFMPHVSSIHIMISGIKAYPHMPASREYGNTKPSAITTYLWYHR